MRSSKRDHSGHHEHNGTLVMGADVWPDIKRAITKVQAGEPLSEREASAAYSAYQTAQHEINHGVNPVYAGAGESQVVGIEEALTEELAHPQTLEWMRSIGLEEIAQWALADPGHMNLKGVYWHHRKRFRELLDQAEVPEQDRRAVMEKMKFNMDSNERVEYLAGLLAAATGTPRRWRRGRCAARCTTASGWIAAARSRARSSSRSCPTRLSLRASSPGRACWRS